MKSLLASNLRALRVLATLAAITFSQPAQAILDTNANLLSDLWEKQHNNGNLFAPTILAENDEDQDGWNNAQEAAAGTDPFNPNPPDGIVTVTITPSLTPGAFTLTWPTLVGKNYQLKVSTDLLTWTNLGDPITTTQTTHSIGINTTQPDTTIPPKVFWRITVSDLDTDGEGLTDAEENELGTDRYSTNSIPGIPDLWLATHFSTLLLTNGIAGINMYADPDGDGYTNLEENLNGTDPNVSDAPTQQQWIIVKGDGPQGEPRTRTKQITIPKGQTRLVVVAIASEEYPQFTEPDDIEQFDDLLTWNIAPTGQTPIEGEVHVNDRHVDWELAEIDGQTLTGIPGPVHYEVVKTVTAPETSDLTIDVEISATNIADERLPSYVAVGLMPVEIVIPKVDANGTPINAELVYARELKVAKLEHSIAVKKHLSQIVSEDINLDNDPDRFYVRILGGAVFASNKDISANLMTAENSKEQYNDNETLVDLFASNGNLVSKSQILTADQVDDDYSGSIEIGVDDALNDRTHMIQLGGKLVLKNIKIDDDTYDVNLKIEVRKFKKVTVNFAILNDGNINLQNVTAEIERDIKVLKERYAQVGIDMVSAGIATVQVPAGLEIVNNEFKVTKTEKSLSEDCKAVINACGTIGDINDIHIVYCPYQLVDHRRDEMDGIALTDYFNAEPNDAGYLSNALITIGQPLQVALAHEVGHILSEIHVEAWILNDPNMVELWPKKTFNLMTAEPADNSDTNITGSRRLWKAQEARMRASVHSKDL